MVLITHIPFMDVSFSITAGKSKVNDYKPPDQLGFIALLAPKAQKLLPGEKLAKIFDF
jgi:hypothetical protein